MKACMTVSDDQRLLDFEDRMSAGQLLVSARRTGLPLDFEVKMIHSYGGWVEGLIPDAEVRQAV